MKAAPGIAYGALLLVACATAQTVGNDSISGSVADAGYRRDSGTAPAAGGNAESAGGAPSMSSGGTDPGSTAGSSGSGVGGATDASGGSGGTTPHDAAAGGAPTGGAPSDGGSTGAGGATSAGGSTVQGTGGTCAAGQKTCDGACTTEVPSNGCSATSCSACPIPAPANGVQICDAQGQCDFECLSGYEKNGADCTMGGGSGGAGSVDAGSGGEPAMCGRQTCHRCLGNLVGCCDKQGEQCLCVLRNQMNLCGS